ncbi:MAG TPA: tetratricopeptide repeat protein, partial [Croceibacterium sp.]|nr:tetratricopeptide repeat protein [Croceibacterium sp.]
PRFHMLETIRAYGQLRLDESGERDDVYAAHTAHFARLAADARERLLGADQLDWFARLQADHDNLQSATRHAIAARDAETATRMVGNLGWYWWIRGHRHEGVDLAAGSLALPPAGLGPSEARASACLIGALLAVDGTHELDVAMNWFDMAHHIVVRINRPVDPLLRLVTPLRTLFALFQHPDRVSIDDFRLPVDDDHPWIAATALAMRAHTMLNFGRTGPEPIEDFNRAYAMFSTIGERWGMAFSLTALANLSAWDGKFSEAIAYLEEALRCVTELSVWEESINARLQLARLLWIAGDHERARAELARGAVEAARFGAPDQRAMADATASEIARLEGDLTNARRLLDQASGRIAPHTVAPQLQAVMASAYAFLDMAEGRVDAARTGHRRALYVAISSVDAPVIAQCMLGLAEMALIDGDPARSALVLGASEAVRGAPDRSLPDGTRIAEAIRTALGDSAFDEHHRRGLQMAVEEIDELIGARLPRRV